MSSESFVGMSVSLWWLSSGKGDFNAGLYCILAVPHHTSGTGLWWHGDGTVPLAQSKASPCPQKVCMGAAGPARCTGVQCWSLAWDAGRFRACPRLLQPGSYPLLDAFLPASGEERSGRAAFCSLKVICQLQQEEKRSAARALGRAGGRTEWQAARTAMLISAATRCLKNRALCFALGFFFLPLRFS